MHIGVLSNSAAQLTKYADVAELNLLMDSMIVHCDELTFIRVRSHGVMTSVSTPTDTMTELPCSHRGE